MDARMHVYIALYSWSLTTWPGYEARKYANIISPFTHHIVFSTQTGVSTYWESTRSRWFKTKVSCNQWSACTIDSYDIFLLLFRMNDLSQQEAWYAVFLVGQINVILHDPNRYSNSLFTLAWNSSKLVHRMVLKNASHIQVCFSLPLAVAVYIPPLIALLNLSPPCHSSLQLLSTPADAGSTGIFIVFLTARVKDKVLNIVPLERFCLYQH